MIAPGPDLVSFVTAVAGSVLSNAPGNMMYAILSPRQIFLEHRTEEKMGLAVCVGMLAELREEDEEGLESLQGELSMMNKVLAEKGLQSHQEPLELPELSSRCSLDGFPYSFLHYLRRVGARVMKNPDWKAESFPEDADPADDPVIGEQTNKLTSHLLCHSDCEGFYVPIDFRNIVFDEKERIPGGMLGSSQRLMEELVSIAPALGISLRGGKLSDEEAQRIDDETESESGLWIENVVWLSLYEAARLSIQHGTVIMFA